MGYPEQGNSTLAAVPSVPKLHSVAEELMRLKDMLRAEFPRAKNISFDYDTLLRVHIDVRTRDEAFLTEGKLSLLGGGMFSDIHRGSKPRHPFMQRISAVVAG